MPNKKKRELTDPHTYIELKSAVTQVLVTGQKQIEALKVQTYWDTGSLIQDYLAKFPEEVGHGKRVIDRLSKDLHIERTVFYRILKFRQSFSNVAARQHLTWSHYRELLAVPGKKQREQLANLAEEGEWPTRRLIEEVKKNVKRGAANQSESSSTKLDEPAKGTPGIAQMGWYQSPDGPKEKKLDLGFEVYLDIPQGELDKIEIGEKVEYSKDDRDWIRANPSEDLHFYEGDLERVVDGDTLLVRVHLGLGITRRVYLRLRALDAKPLEQPQGKKAHEYLASLAKKNTRIEFKSRFRDPYDRYLSDVWMDGVYVNQALIDKGLAERVKG